MDKQGFWWLPVLGTCAVFLFGGCGPGRGDLSGTVSYQGKLLRHGTVTVLGSDGIPKASLIKNGGSYAVHDLAAGRVKITIYSPDPWEVKIVQRKPDVAPPKLDRTGWFAIPEKYTDFDKSGLTFDLKSGSNSYAIELP